MYNELKTSEYLLEDNTLQRLHKTESENNEETRVTCSRLQLEFEQGIQKTMYIVRQRFPQKTINYFRAARYKGFQKKIIK